MNPAIMNIAKLTSPTALIAEDEPLLAKELANQLAALWPELKIVAVAPNGLAALALIEQHKPDIVFLDIKMPGLSGLDVAGNLIEDLTEPPLIVFVTAYDQFAIQAFENAAIDFVLKPVNPARLAKTILRLKRNLSADNNASDFVGLASQLQQLLSAPRISQEWLTTITASVGQHIKFVSVSEVVYFEASDKYVRVLTASAEVLIREPLKLLAPKLDPAVFKQIHRSVIVNGQFIKHIERDETGKLHLHLTARPEKLVISRLYAHTFKPM